MSLPVRAAWGRRARRAAPLDPNDPAAFFAGETTAEGGRPRRQRRTEEADFQEQLLNLARLLGWLAFHDYASERNEPGLPDLVLVKAPRVIFAELKSAKGKPTKGHMGRYRWLPGQEDWLRELRACAGVETYLWRPADFREAEAILMGEDWGPGGA